MDITNVESAWSAGKAKYDKFQKEYLEQFMRPWRVTQLYMMIANITPEEEALLPPGVLDDMKSKLKKIVGG